MVYLLDVLLERLQASPPNRILFLRRLAHHWCSRWPVRIPSANGPSLFLRVPWRHKGFVVRRCVELLRSQISVEKHNSVIFSSKCWSHTAISLSFCRKMCFSVILQNIKDYSRVYMKCQGIKQFLRRKRDLNKELIALYHLKFVRFFKLD